MIGTWLKAWNVNSQSETFTGEGKGKSDSDYVKDLVCSV